MHASCNVESSFNEPDLVRAKGCGKRLKGGKEKALAKAKNKKVRRCHGCGKVGQAEPALGQGRQGDRPGPNVRRGTNFYMCICIYVKNI
ncbi:hypothetical protein LguiA_016152 [Lonicera macranthoides]